MSTQLSLGIFAELDAARDAARDAAHVRQQIHYMRICWPEWEGPRVSDDIHGRCSVGTCVVHSEKVGGPAYHYDAPCRIIEVSPDGLTVRAVIEYHTPSSLADTHNGTILRLHITEVWPPVHDLIKARDQYAET